MKATEITYDLFKKLDPVTLKLYGEDSEGVLNTRIPEWLDFEVESPIVVKKQHNGVYAIYKDEEVMMVKSNTTLYKTIEEIKKELTKNIVIDDDEIVKISEEGYFVSTESDTESVLKIKYDLHSFYKLSKRWRENPTFINSYYFITNHPMFWLRYKESWVWDTFHQPSVEFMEEDGKVVCLLEAGEHVEPDYNYHYHDYELDTYADTYEKAIIKLAKKIDSLYDDNGTSKNVLDKIN